MSILAPKLRFKQDDGSDFPDWEEKRLDEITGIIGGGTPDTAIHTYWNGGISWFTPSEINRKYLQTSQKMISRSGLKNSSAKMLPAGTLLLSTRATIGEIGIATKACTTNQGFQSLIVQSASNEFLYYWIKSHKIEFLRRAAGSIFLEISKSEVSKIKVHVPSLPEQQKIAEFLGSVDQKIDMMKRKRDALTRYKKGLMQQIFSQKIRFKQDDGSDFPDWEEKRLGDTAIIFKGKGISRNDISEDGVLPCILYGEIYTKYNEKINDIFSYTNLSIDKLILSKNNDVIIPASGETSTDISTACCVLKGGVALGGDINIIRGKNDGIFLSYYLRHSKREISRLAQGNSVVHLYAKQLQLLNIFFPSLPEQQKIADFLGSIDEKISVVECRIEKLENFKKGLLQQMFI